MVAQGDGSRVKDFSRVLNSPTTSSLVSFTVATLQWDYWVLPQPVGIQQLTVTKRLKLPTWEKGLVVCHSREGSHTERAFGGLCTGPFLELPSSV